MDEARGRSTGSEAGRPPAPRAKIPREDKGDEIEDNLEDKEDVDEIVEDEPEKPEDVDQIVEDEPEMPEDVDEIVEDEPELLSEMLFLFEAHTPLELGKNRPELSHHLLHMIHNLIEFRLLPPPPPPRGSVSRRDSPKVWGWSSNGCRTCRGFDRGRVSGVAEEFSSG